VPLKNYIATSACWTFALLLAGAGAAPAESVGVVTDLNGSLLAKGADGAIKVLGLNSPLEQGDTLASRSATYAHVTLADHSDVVLGPNTELKFEKYSFHEAGSQNDAAVLSLLKGRVRIAAGLLGRRSNESFTLVTPSATIDIRGSIFIADYVAPDRTPVVGQDARRQALRSGIMVAVGYTPTAVFKHVSMRSFNTRAPLLLAQNTVGNGSAGLSPGLYVQVLDGAIHLTNGGGTQNFTAGQFGFTPGFQQPPVILPPIRGCSSRRSLHFRPLRVRKGVPAARNQATSIARCASHIRLHVLTRVASASGGH
jgi:hypothetical protein